MRLKLHHALAAQRAQRLTHRCDADPQRSGGFVEPDERPGPKRAGHDVVAQTGRDLVGELLATDRPPPLGAGPGGCVHDSLRLSGLKLAWFLLHVARYLPGQIYASDAAWGAAAVAGHRELIEALRRRDVDTVVRLTSGEFTDAAQRLVARLDEIGLWS
jgi:hypothetical protein